MKLKGKIFYVFMLGLFIQGGFVHSGLYAQTAETPESEDSDKLQTEDTSGETTSAAQENDSENTKPADLDPLVKIGLQLGLAWFGQAYPTSPDSDYPDTNGIRASTLLENGGFSVPLRLAKNIYFSPGIEFIFDEYLYKTSLGMAFPTHIETGSAAGGLVASVMDLMINLPVDFRIDLSSKTYLELSPGLSFILFIPYQTIETDDSASLDDMFNYLNKDAKFIYPSSSVQFFIKLSEVFEGGFRLRALYPIWHIWSSEELDFYDRMIIDFSAVVRFIPEGLSLK